MNAPPITCTVHRSLPAAWQCVACNRLLCPDCAVSQEIRGSARPAVSCLACGGFARVLTRERRIDPYWISYRVFLANMFTRAGLTQLSAVALALYLSSLIPGVVGPGLKAFISASYFFQVLDRAAHGEESLPLPADFLGLESFLVSTRFALASFLIWGPALIYALRGVSAFELLNHFDSVVSERVLDPAVLLIFLAGVAYYPAALITGAVADSFWAMLAPWITLRMIARIPAHYFLTVLVVAVLSVLDLLVASMLDAIQARVFLPLVLPLLVVLAKLPLRLTIAFILGRLIFQNAEHFGIVSATSLEEPVYPGAVPRAAAARTRS